MPLSVLLQLVWVEIPVGTRILGLGCIFTMDFLPTTTQHFDVSKALTLPPCVIRVRKTDVVLAFRYNLSAGLSMESLLLIERQSYSQLPDVIL